MPITRSNIPNLLLDGIKGTFFDAYDNIPSQWEQVAMVIPSTHKVETYDWLGQIEGMREFKDKRKVQSLIKEYSFTIENKKWEATIGVESDVLDDDQYGQVMARVRGLAARAARHKDSLVFGLLNNAFDSAYPCYDGKAMCADDHAFGDNKLALDLDETNLKAAITAMMSFVDDQGELLGVIPDTLIVPPALKWDAKELLNSVIAVASNENKTGNQINTLQGELDLIVSPYITDSDSWFVAQLKNGLKPIIMQDRKPLEWRQLGLDSETGFMEDKFVYGVKARYNVGWGLPEYILGSTGAG